MKRTNKLFRTLIALAVALLMTLSTVPVTALAADDTATVQQAASGNFFEDLINVIFLKFSKNLQ